MQRKKRIFLFIGIVLLTLRAIALAQILPEQKVDVSTDDYVLHFNDGQGFVIIDGVQALQVGSVSLEWSPQYFEGTSAEPDGETSVDVSYKVEKDDTGKASLTAKYTCLPNVIRVHLELSVPSGVETGGAMFQCSPMENTAKGELYKSGVWTRDPNGGTSYEVKDAYFRQFTNPDKKILLKLLGNPNWDGEDFQHIPFTRVGESDTYTSDIEIFILPAELSNAAAAALVAEVKRDAAVEIFTSKAGSAPNPYNLFKPEESAKFTVRISNVQSTAMETDLTIIARNLDNQALVNETVHVSLGSLDQTEITRTLPSAERELYFVEASLSVNGTEYFSRTNVAFLPDFQFEHKDESVFGISAYFKLPDNMSALRLLDRLGVHLLRDGNNQRIPATVDLLAFAHSDPGVNARDIPDALKKKWIRNSLSRFVMERDNALWEFGNEWNLVDNPDDLEGVANLYATWVKYAVAIRDYKAYPIKIVSQGIGGWDPDFLRYLKRNGCYRQLDGIAFHPGRGNVTADAETADAEGGNEWNYYGTVKKYSKFARANGNKPVYASEVYAGTLPNCYNKDSYRQAAGNIVLSLALGLAQGLSAIEVYQLNDGTHYDVGGLVSEELREEDGHEYHYGLLMRDLSLKPSAMAYAITAEVLDGAKFVEYRDSGDTTLRVLIFEKDGSKIAILWDRVEGHMQANVGENLHLEPWLPTYTMTRSHTFTTVADEITVIDMIGRKRTIATTDHVVELKLNGEPIFVYGLDP